MVTMQDMFSQYARQGGPSIGSGFGPPQPVAVPAMQQPSHPMDNEAMQMLMGLAVKTRGPEFMDAASRLAAQIHSNNTQQQISGQETAAKLGVHNSDMFNQYQQRQQIDFPQIQNKLAQSQAMFNLSMMDKLDELEQRNKANAIQSRKSDPSYVARNVYGKKFRELMTQPGMTPARAQQIASQYADYEGKQAAYLQDSDWTGTKYENDPAWVAKWNAAYPGDGVAANSDEIVDTINMLLKSGVPATPELVEQHLRMQGRALDKSKLDEVVNDARYPPWWGSRWPGPLAPLGILYRKAFGPSPEQNRAANAIRANRHIFDRMADPQMAPQ